MFFPIISFIRPTYKMKTIVNRSKSSQVSQGDASTLEENEKESLLQSLVYTTHTL